MFFLPALSRQGVKTVLFVAIAFAARFPSCFSPFASEIVATECDKVVGVLVEQFQLHNVVLEFHPHFTLNLTTGNNASFETVLKSM